MVRFSILLVSLVCLDGLVTAQPWSYSGRGRQEDYADHAPWSNHPPQYTPKFSRHTPFMTADSLPAPVYGRYRNGPEHVPYSLYQNSNVPPKIPRPATVQKFSQKEVETSTKHPFTTTVWADLGNSTEMTSWTSSEPPKSFSTDGLLNMEANSEDEKELEVEQSKFKSERLFRLIKPNVPYNKEIAKILSRGHNQDLFSTTAASRADAAEINGSKIIGNGSGEPISTKNPLFYSPLQGPFEGDELGQVPPTTEPPPQTSDAVEWKAIDFKSTETSTTSPKQDENEDSKEDRQQPEDTQNEAEKTPKNHEPANFFPELTQLFPQFPGFPSNFPQFPGFQSPNNQMPTPPEWPQKYQNGDRNGQ